jgi:hypothetical protein
MEKHVTALGVIFLVVGIMGLIGMGIVMTLFMIGAAAISTAAAHEPDVPAILSFLPAVFGFFVASMIAVSAIPALIAGYGLLKLRPWARIWALLAGVINLANFPVGTAAGIYAIWFFVQDDPEQVLSG